MIKIEDVDISGIKNAIKGMRNPYDSWDKSDSNIEALGEADLSLALRLAKAGTEHRKYLRMIHVQVDVTAPFYWWKEFDTYKIGTVSNSCSTMHTLHKKPLTIEDFSFDNADDIPENIMNNVINNLNSYREKFIETKNKVYWRYLIQMLPMSYNQKRTIDLNYEVLLTIYKQRKGHKLTEWHEFRDWIETLPYMKEFIGGQE